MDINNRRYIGCKTKLLTAINEEVEKCNCTNKDIFFDVFAGTGVVSYYFAKKGFSTILNDILFSNVIAYNAFFLNEPIRKDYLEKQINRYNSIDSTTLEENYFMTIYGDKYFTKENAKKIGFIRDDIEIKKDKLNYREYAYLITSLMYATDRVANTVGHYESYLKNKLNNRELLLETLDITSDMPIAHIYNEDANELVRKVDADIVYLDPPYNARQYVNFYHVLENLARWNKPNIDTLEGDSMKFPRDFLKSNYCRKNKAEVLFADLIEHIKAKIIIVSYNNTYSAKSDSSNNTIRLDYIVSVLSNKGKTRVKEIDYKPFNSGKTTLNQHKEYLITCIVN